MRGGPGHARRCAGLRPGSEVSEPSQPGSGDETRKEQPRIACPDLATGEVLGKASGSKSLSSIIAGDGRIFDGNAAGICFQHADHKDFRDLPPSAGGVSLGGPAGDTIIVGTPETVALYPDGRLFTRNFDALVCYDPRAGRNVCRRSLMIGSGPIQ